MGITYGSSGYHYSADNPASLQALNGTAQMTAIVRFRCDSKPYDYTPIFTQQCYEGGVYYWDRILLGVRSSGSFVVGAWCGSSEPAINYGTATNDVWYVLGMTIDTTLGSNQMKMFVDGAHVGSATASGNLSSNGKWVGLAMNNNASTLGPDNFCPCKIADFWVFNRALSADEMATQALAYGEIEELLPGYIYGCRLEDFIEGSAAGTITMPNGETLTGSGSGTRNGYGFPHRQPLTQVF